MALAAIPAVDRWRAAHEAGRQLARASQTTAGLGPGWWADAGTSLRVRELSDLLASWQTVGGCGAGASTSTGAGVKWIGRNVTGGLFHIESQANYVKTTYGYNYIGTTLLSRDLDEKWNLGVSVPYLYKYMTDPYALGFDVSNKGLGDVTVLVTRRFGAINDTSAALGIGLPTGTHDAHLLRSETTVLPQDRQLGLGKATASLTVDHIVDNIWGPTVLGGLVAWRGGENDLHSYRAPSATLYGYSGYLLGPFTPAIGLSSTGFTAHDRDQGELQGTALFNVAASVSLEWATDWIAVLVGGSLPYQYDGNKIDADGHPRNPWGFGPWIVALGVAVSPF